MFLLRHSSRAIQRKLIRTRSSGLTFARTMASSSPAAPEKFEWLVILPDNEGALPKRMEVRPLVFHPSINLTSHQHATVSISKASNQVLTADSGRWEVSRHPPSYFRPLTSGQRLRRWE